MRVVRDAIDLLRTRQYVYTGPVLLTAPQPNSVRSTCTVAVRAVCSRLRGTHDYKTADYSSVEPTTGHHLNFIINSSAALLLLY